MTDRIQIFQRARDYGALHGDQAAWDVFGTTGYSDVDMKYITQVEIILEKPRPVIRMIVPPKPKRRIFAGGIE